MTACAQALRLAALGALVALLGAAPAASGRDLYATHCVTCHGADLGGTSDGPSLRGTGAASVDWWVGSGRMPAALPWIEADRKRAIFTQAQIDRIAAYVTSVAPGGPPIPRVGTASNLVRGRDLYEENCEHCHGASAQGEALANGWIAPALSDVPVNQVAEAVRIGPMPMPHFGERQISPAELDDIVGYVKTLQTRTDDPGGLSLGHFGPVPEGIVAWLFGAGVLLAFVRAVGTND